MNKLWEGAVVIVMPKNVMQMEVFCLLMLLLFVLLSSARGITAGVQVLACQEIGGKKNRRGQAKPRSSTCIPASAPLCTDDTASTGLRVSDTEQQVTLYKKNPGRP